MVLWVTTTVVTVIAEGLPEEERGKATCKLRYNVQAVGRRVVANHPDMLESHRGSFGSHDAANQRERDHFRDYRALLPLWALRNDRKAPSLG